MTLQELLVRISADVSDYTRGVDQAKQKTTELDESFEKSSRSLESLGGKMTSIGAGLTAAITVPLAGVAAASLKVAGDLEMATVAFGTMMQSSERAKAHLDQLRQFALSTPFNFPELVDASKRLQALGFTAGEVIPTMRAIGNAAAALGSGAQGIERISLALGQMQAKGKVSAEEMRQLGEAGIPGWHMLAEALSKVEGKAVSVAEVMKRAELGQISGGVGVDALLKGLEKNFGGLMELQSQTLAGMFSNLKERVIQTFTSIGEALTPLAKSVITELSGIGDAVNVGIARFRELPTWVQGSTLAFAGLAAAAGPALLVFGKLVESFGSIGVALAKVSTLLGEAGIVGLLPTVATAVAAVGAAFLGWKLVETGASLVELVKNMTGLDSILAPIIGAVKSLGEAIGLLPAVREIQIGLRVVEQQGGTSAMDLLFGPGTMGLAGIKRGADLMNAGGAEEQKYMAGKLQGSVDRVRSGGVASIRDQMDVEQRNRDKEIDAKRREKAAAEAKAKEAQKQLKADEKLLGVEDYEAELKALEAAYYRLAATGKFTEDELNAAWDKATGSAHKYSDAVKFADKSFDNKLLMEQFAEDGTEQKRLEKEALAAKKAAKEYEALTGEFQRMDSFLENLRADYGEMSRAEEEAALRNSGLFAKKALELNALANAAMQANAAFQSPADVAAMLKQAKANAPSMGLTNPELGDFEKQNKAVANAMRDLGVRPKPSSEQAQKDYALIHEAYLSGDKRISTSTDLEAERKKIQEMVIEQRAAGGTIMAEQSSRLFEINKTLAKSMKDTWTSVYNEVNKSFSTLFDGIGKSIVNLDLKPLLDSLKKIGASIISTTFDTLTKPLVEKLSKGLTDALLGVVGKKAVEKVEEKVEEKVVEKVADKAIDKVANKVPGKIAGKAVSGVAGGAMQTIGAIGSAASAVSGIISNFQNAKMETTLNAIEESTRYVKIWTGEQSDSILETLHIIRNRILDFTATYGFSMLVDLTVEQKDMIAGILENTTGIKNLNALLGSVGTVTGKDGELVTTGGGLDVIVAAIQTSSESIVTAIDALADSLAKATVGVAVGGPGALDAGTVPGGPGAIPTTSAEAQTIYEGMLSQKAAIEEQIALLKKQTADLDAKGKNETQAEKDQERINRAQVTVLNKQLSDLMARIEMFIKMYSVVPPTSPASGPATVAAPASAADQIAALEKELGALGVDASRITRESLAGLLKSLPVDEWGDDAEHRLAAITGKAEQLINLKEQLRGQSAGPTPGVPDYSNAAATQGFDTTAIQAILTVNQTIIEQTTRLIEAMGGGMGGGAATGGGGEDLEAVVKQMFGDSARVMPNDTVGEMLKGGASQSEIGAFLDNFAGSYEFLPGGGVKYFSEASNAAGSGFNQVAQHASIAATELDSFGGALVTAQQVMTTGILGHAYWNALSEWESGGRKGNAPVTSDYYTDHNEQGLSVIGDLQAQGGFNVPPDLSYWMDNYGRGGTSLDPKRLTSGKNIVITNNTFRSREDLDYLVHLAKAQL